jgi:hypothetical protein
MERWESFVLGVRGSHGKYRRAGVLILYGVPLVVALTVVVFTFAALFVP